MKITSIKSHVLIYELEKELGYSQQYYKHRTAHLVEVQTNEGITGWGECFGPGNIALANKYLIHPNLFQRKVHLSNYKHDLHQPLI